MGRLRGLREGLLRGSRLGFEGGRGVLGVRESGERGNLREDKKWRYDSLLLCRGGFNWCRRDEDIRGEVD